MESLRVNSQLKKIFLATDVSSVVIRAKRRDSRKAKNGVCAEQKDQKESEKIRGVNRGSALSCPLAGDVAERRSFWWLPTSSVAPR
jgi:hypothetical protein